MNTDEILRQFRDVERTGTGWQAKCPAHDDAKASLSIRAADDGKTLLKCHAGCSTTDVCRAAGLELCDLFATSNGHATKRGAVKPPGKIVAKYDYRDERGELLFQVCRKEPKNFVQRMPDGAGGWTYKLNGVRRVLYRLPAIMAADAAEPVFIVEGEKDADNLAALGILATTNAGGAEKWRDDYAAHFAGRHVVIVPDNDTPGERHAIRVAASLSGKAASVRILTLPDLPPKGDVSDWINAGGTAHKLRELAANVDEFDPAEHAGPENAPKESPKWTGSRPDPTEATLPNLTDLGNAERFATQHGRRIRYCAAWRKRVSWDGKRWVVGDEGQAIRLATETVRQIYIEAANATDAKSRESIADWAQKSESTHRIESLLKLARAKLPIDPTAFDKNPWLLNCPNGTVDLRTGELRSHDPGDFITQLCPTEYDPDAECPAWERFQRQIHNVAEGSPMIPFKQRLYGYFLTGDVREQILAIYYGTGSNGKSLEVETVLFVMGDDYAGKAPRDFLTQSISDRHPTELADLCGKRFVFATETDDGRRLSEGLVKELTGSDTIKARRMREDFWAFRPTHKIALITNYKPRVYGNDNGIWRRLVLIDFGQRFWNPDMGETGEPDRRQDKTLPDKLRAEAAGVLAWMVRGCREWLRIGLQIPDSVREATTEYRDSEDILASFLDECCDVLPELKARSSDIVTTFKDWAGRNGQPELSGRKIGDYLANRGFAKFKSNGVVWKGLGIKPLYAETGGTF